MIYTLMSVSEYMRNHQEKKESLQQERKESLLLNDTNEPKIQFTFDGCYKYNKLKKEGLAP